MRATLPARRPTVVLSASGCGRPSGPPGPVDDGGRTAVCGVARRRPGRAYTDPRSGPLGRRLRTSSLGASRLAGSATRSRAPARPVRRAVSAGVRATTRARRTEPGTTGARTRPTWPAKEQPAMAVVTMRQLLESGVHFGHQTRRWNPKMKRFIFTERNGIYIIDLQQSLSYIDRAYEFVKETVAHGGTVLFVGTKKQAQEAIAEQATRVGMPYVNQRWLGGMLTNFQTVHKRLQRLKELEEIDFDDVAGSGLTKKELLVLRREKDKLEQDPRRHPRHEPRSRARSGSSTPRRSTSPSTRPASCASRSSRSSTPTATRTRSTSRSRATTTRSARSRLLTRVIADAVAEGLMARAGAGQATRSRAPSSAADEPLAEWERELLAGADGRRRGSGRRRRRRGGAEPSVAEAGRRAGRRGAGGRRDHPSPSPQPSLRREAAADGRRPSRRRRPTRGRRDGAGRAVSRLSRLSRHDHARDESSTMATSPPPTSRSSATLTGAGMMDCKKALERGRRRLRQGRRDPAHQGRQGRASAVPSATAAQRPRRRARAAPWSSSTARPTSSPRTTQFQALAERDRRPRPPQTGRPTPTTLLAADAAPTAGPSREAIDDAGRGHRREARAAPGRRARRHGRRLPAPPRRRPAARRSACSWSTRATTPRPPAAPPCRSRRMRPQYLTRDEVPADVVDDERRIAEATAREEGKPEAALPKIVEGRVNGFFKERRPARAGRRSQDQKKTVAQVLAEAGTTVTRFARFEVGRPDPADGHRRRPSEARLGQAGDDRSRQVVAATRGQPVADGTGRAGPGRRPTAATAGSCSSCPVRRSPAAAASASTRTSSQTIARQIADGRPRRRPGRRRHRRRQLLPRGASCPSAAWTAPAPTTWACSARS